MHICVLSVLGISPSLSNWGGVQTHTKNLISLLISRGYRVTFITTSGENINDGQLTIIPVNYFHTPRPDNIWFQKAYKELLCIHGKEPLDCVFAEGGSARGLLTSLEQLNIPVVQFTHNISINYFFNQWMEVDGLRSLNSYVFRSLPRFFYDMLRYELVFLRRYDKVVTGSAAIAQRLVRWYRIPENKIVVIHNWVDHSLFRYDKSAGHATRRQLNIHNDAVIFLLVGSVWKPKGFRTALHAFNQVSKSLPNLHLMIAGDGPDKSYMEKYIAKHHLKSVKLIGQFPHSELPALFSASDVFLIPSLLNEVLPYTLLEAMSCQLPVIATRIPANSEALGPTGLYVSRGRVRALAEAMLDFASSIHSKKVIDGIANRQRIIDLFSPEVASQKLEQLLEELVY